MKHIVVTGASGYVGSRLVGHLRESGHSVMAVARDASVLPDDIETVDLDLTDEDTAPLESVASGADAIVHLAGPSEVLARVDPDGCIRQTTAAARHVASAAASSGIPRVVYLSTVHVYGEGLEGPGSVSEQDEAAPNSPYGRSRLLAEQAMAAALPDGALAVLRMSNAVGPPAAAAVDRWTLVTLELCRDAAVAGVMRLRSPGMQTRDFIALDDACRALEAAAAPSRVPAGILNLASGTATRIRDVAELVADSFVLMGEDRPRLEAPAPRGEEGSPVRIDVGLLADLGLAATTPLQDAVAETVAFCIEHRAALAELGAMP